MSDDRPWYREPETSIAIAAHWMMTAHLTERSSWRSVTKCPEQRPNTDF